MAPKRLFVVLGATGLQGGSIIKHILSTNANEYTIRAITRNPSSSAGINLAASNIEVVQADLDDPASLEKAFKGANVIFAVTDYFTTLSATAEVTQGLNIIKAAEGAAIDTLEHFIWSGLPDPRTFSTPYHNILHFNSKADIDEELRKSGIWGVSTVVWVGQYFENWVKFANVFAPTKQADGTFKLSLPVRADSPIMRTAVDEVGPLVLAILSDPRRFHKEIVALVTDCSPTPEQLDTWSKVVGVKAIFEETSMEDYNKHLQQNCGFPNFVALELAENMVAFRDEPGMFALNGAIPSEEVIERSIITWKTFVERCDWSPILDASTT